MTKKEFVELMKKVRTARRNKGHSQSYMAGLLGITSCKYSLFERGVLWTSNEVIIGILKEYTKVYTTYRYKPNSKSALSNPTQRIGKAHLCINETLICGEKDIEHVRYYRSHEYFLNQCEICEECRDKFLQAFPFYI